MLQFMETSLNSLASPSPAPLLHDLPGLSIRELISPSSISALTQNQFEDIIRQMSELLSESEWQETDFIAGIEPEGILLAAGLAIIKQKGLVKIQKLPRQTYGRHTLHMPDGNGRIVIVDHAMTREKTLEEATIVAMESGYTPCYCCCMINFSSCSWYLNVPLRCLIEYREERKGKKKKLPSMY